ncbi:MAG: efflux RND transporter permease subunit [Chloroflexota bacterium]
MTRLTQLAISKRSVTLLLALGLFAGGIFSWGQLRQELVPDVDFPILTIVSTYPGAGSSDVTEQVTKPIERAITSVAGLESLNATSANSLAFVVAQFEFGTDIKEAKATVEANLDALNLPTGVQPRVIVADINSQAVIVASVQGAGDLTLEDAARIARTEIVPELIGVSGVSAVSVTGGAEERVKIALDPAKLAESGVSLQQIQGVLQANDLTIPTGTIRIDDGQVSVSALHQFGSVDELRALIVGVKTPSGVPIGTSLNPPSALPVPVRLGALGTIDTIEVQPTGYSRTNGVPSITLSVTKASGGNTVQVAEDVQTRLDELQEQYAGRLTLTTLIDTSDFIKESRDGLVKEGGLGSAFAVLIIFLFLLNVRSTLVAAVSIPLSLVAALAFMLVAGISINIMTLGGLAVAIGRVVDDAIVVLENIYRHRGRGDSMRDAVLNGTREVASAITSSTLTTVAVFLPLGFVGGLISQFFLPFALTVTFALLASLIVSLTVVPVLAVFLLRTVKITVGPDGELPETIWQRIYDPMLRLALRSRITKWATIGLAAALFVGTSGLVAGLPTQFIDSGSEKISYITVIPPAGTSTADVIARAELVEAYLIAAPNVELALTTIPSADDTSFQTLASAQSGRPANTARIFVRFHKDVDLEAEVDKAKAGLAALASDGFSITAEEQSGFGGSTLSAVITGSDADLLAAANDAVLEALSTIPELDNVTSDLIRSSPEIQVRVDPNRAIGLGLTTAQVAGDLRNIIVGGPAGRIVVDGRSIQVDMQLAVDDLGSLDALEAIPVGTVRQAPLGSIADVVQVDAQTRVTRVDGASAATVSGAIRSADQGGVATIVDERIRELRDAGRLEGVDVNVGGVTAQQAEAFGGLFAAMAVAILLVYLVMVLVFNSLVDPLVIMFSLPLATIGAFPALAITGRPIGISALIGFLMLIGIVVTNAIVLLDLVEQLRHKGMGTHDALVQAGRTRVRPILMTAVATIMALFPLALGLNEGSIIAAELGTVVIGGLLSSTFLTLLVVPAVYSLVDGGKVAVRRRFGAGEDHPELPDEFAEA